MNQEKLPTNAVLPFVLSIAVFAVVACVVARVVYRESRTVDDRGAPPAIKAGNADPHCAYTRALAQLSMGRQAQAERLLDAACATHPDDQRLCFARAVCAHSRFAKNRSVRMMTDVAKMDPVSVEGRCADLIVKLETRHVVSRDFTNLSVLLDQNPTNPMLLWVVGIQCRTLAQEHRGTNYSVKGADCYRRLLEQWQVGPVLVHQTYANILSEELDRHEEALKHRRLAVQLEPKGWSYQGLGNTLMNLKRYDEANEAFAKCNELAPNDAQFLRSWAVNLCRQGNHEKSIAMCRRAAELDPQDDRVWSVWGDNLNALGREEEAIVKYRKHLQLHPDRKDFRDWVVSLEGMVEYRNERNKRLQRLREQEPGTVERIEAYATFSTNMVFSTTDRDVIEGFCAACRDATLHTNAEPVGVSAKCDIVVVLNDGQKYELCVSTYADETMIWGHFASFTPDRKSAHLYGPVQAPKLAAWLKNNIDLPPPPKPGPSRHGATNGVQRSSMP